jgi:hypothetical protein
MKKSILCISLLLLTAVSFSLQDSGFNTGTGWTVNGTASVSYNGYCNITKQLFNTQTEVYQEETAFTSGKTYQVEFTIPSLSGKLIIGWQNISAEWKAGSYQTVTTGGTYTLTCNDYNYNWVVMDTDDLVVVANIDSAITSEVSAVTDWELY